MISSSIKAFDDLTLLELYAILSLREHVFTFGQKVNEEDMDGRDPHAFHFMLGADASFSKLLGTARIFPPQESDKGAVYIGRVGLHENTRGQGLGRRLMEEILDFCAKTWPKSPIHLSAQAYLEKFYTSLGFDSQGEIYEEAGIPHIFMTRAL